MAALQTLRNKPALLMSVIGGALLLFIVTMVMENQTGLMGADMEAGEVYGEEISIQDFDSKVTQEQNYQEVARTLGNYFQTGQLDPQQLTEREREEIRQQVWNDILAVATVKDEAKKFGLMGLATQENQYLDGRIVLNCGDATAAEIDEEVMKMLKQAYAEAKRLLSENREALDKIAAFLIEKETITGKEFMKIFREVKGIPAPEEGQEEKIQTERISMKPDESAEAADNPDNPDKLQP